MADPGQSYHRDDLQTELLECATRIIGTEGVEALSLRELGRNANVSRAAPYHYFPTKAALLDRVGALGFARLGGRIEAEMAGAADPLERALAGFQGYLAFALSEPAIFQLMFANRLSRPRPVPGGDPFEFPFSSDEARRTFKLIVDGLAELGVSSGRGEAERLAWINMAWAFAHGVAVLACGDNLKGVEAETLLEQGLRLLLADRR